MARIQPIDPAAANGKARELLDAVKAKLGKAPNMMRTMAQSPAVLEAYLGLSGPLGNGALSHQLREQVALFIAQAVECDYCVAAHNTIGKMAGLTDDARLAARRGRGGDTRSDAALRFVKRVLDTHGGVSEADVSAVRAAGFTDGEIAELIGAVALNLFTTYFNRALDVEVDFPRAEALKA